MRISYLREFGKLCECLNFNEAAAELHISQSALSKHIRALEEDLGAALFERDRYHVVLTSQGETFRQVAYDIVKMYQGAQSAYRADSQNKNRLVVGGLVDSPGLYSWIVGVCEKIMDDVPGFTPHFVPVGYTPATLQVSNGEVDCALLTIDLADYPSNLRNALSTVRIANCEVLAVVSADSKLAQRDRLSTQDLQGRCFVHLMNPRMTSGWKAMEVFLNHNGIRFATKEVQVFSVYDVASLPLGDAVLLLPCTDVQPNLANCPTKALVPLDVDVPASPVDLVFRKDDTSPILHRFIEELKREPLLGKMS